MYAMTPERANLIRALPLHLRAAAPHMNTSDIILAIADDRGLKLPPSAAATKKEPPALSLSTLRAAVAGLEAKCKALNIEDRAPAASGKQLSDEEIARIDLAMGAVTYQDGVRRERGRTKFGFVAKPLNR